MRPIICDHGLMRRINRVRILNLLRLRDSLSRIELTRETGLDGKTVTNLTQELLAKRLIISDGYETSSGGRRPELLRLNSNLKHTIGIYLDPDKIIGVLVDLRGNILKEEIFSLFKISKRKYILSGIKKITQSLIACTTRSRLLGLGFVFPGIIDRDKETIIQSSNLPVLEGIRIKEYFRKNFSLPIEIEDSSRAMALGEKWFGRAQGIDNFVFIELGVGIGCAILSRSQLHYGVSLSAGELGHTVVDINGPRCRCGHKGCLETVASSRKILEKISGKGRKEAQKIIADAGYYIGVGVSNLVNLLNPSHLIIGGIGGELSLVGETLFKAIDRAMKKYTVSSSYNAVQVIPAALGEKGGALGAATLILKKVFELKELE
ncbi:MAG: ROK family protein [Candidatus Omnitrophica bacterium]|nr:ROK family protein [Candidatus Omnitrophota bacterium]